jgi:dihydroxy-acid dehydratase
MPCNFHLALAAKVKEGIRDAGGTPMELNTVAIPTASPWARRHEDLAGLARFIADSIEPRRPRALRRRHCPERLRQSH